VNTVKTVKRILYATDFSKASARALDEAISLAQQNKAELLAVHVIEPVPYAAGEEFASAEIYAKIEEVTDRQAKAAMAKLMQRLKKANVKAQSLLLRGSAHDQIVKAAKSKKTDMIVIGTHGRTGLSKLFMGSVAGKVISSATCPVVTVRGK
jgi:nucleotide-binding universal stress UspA family protein